EDIPLETFEWNEKEEMLVEALQKHKRLTLDQVSKLLGQKTLYHIINALLYRDLIYTEEEVVEKYKPLLKSYLRLNPFYAEQENLKQLFEILERAPKQLDVLMAYLNLSRNQGWIGKQELIEASGCGQAPLKALLDKEVFVLEKK